MDPTLILALLIVGGAALFAFWPAKKPVLPVPASVVPLAAGRPGRTLIDAIDEAGRDAAGAIVETKLGQQKANELIGSLKAAFTDPPAPVPTPAAPSGPSS